MCADMRRITFQVRPCCTHVWVGLVACLHSTQVPMVTSKQQSM